MVNRILLSWSFHLKFMKLAEVSFRKFHMKWSYESYSCKILYVRHTQFNSGQLIASGDSDLKMPHDVAGSNQV